MEFLLGSLVIPLVVFLFHYESEINRHRPRIEIDTIFNAGLSIRNVGDTDAQYIAETTCWFRDVPNTLRAYKGNINYYKDRDPGIYRQIDLQDLNRLEPSKSALVRLEYKDPEGNKFYSEIEIRRNVDVSPPWFFQPKLIKSGRIWW